MRNKYILLFLLIGAIGVFFYLSRESLRCDAPRKQKIKIIKIIPKSDYPFTQGLFFEDNILFESSGLYGKSYLLRRTLDKSAPIIRKELPENIFAEGLTIFEDNVYLISWREQKAMVFDKKDLSFKKEFHYDGEGWGISEFDSKLYLSDGTDEIKAYDKNFRLLSSYKITYQENTLHHLNELEFIKGLLYANIWMTSKIVAIDLEKSCVVKEVDASEIVELEGASNELGNVLNGIAYDKKTDEIILTGKWWKNYYVVKLITP